MMDSIINGPSTRREFIRKMLIAGAAVGLGTYGLGCLFREEDASTQYDVSTLREAMYYIPFGDGGVRCELCPNMCVLDQGYRGVCRTRENINGKLYNLAYGKPCALHNDPIEKKPLFHFLPATNAYSIATAGCNLRCKFCQNWDIAQRRPEDVESVDASPDDIVSRALEKGSSSVAYTYSEPTAFYEYMLDTARKASQNGLRNVVITAGYMNTKPLKELCKHVDAIKVDLKGFNNDYYSDVCDGQLQPVLDGLKTIRESGVWLEIVNLVVPTLNDVTSEIQDMSEWIKDNLGADVPVHFSRFHPDYKLQNLPSTPLSSLETARSTAIDAGLTYVYVGNVPGHVGESTYCPTCEQALIQRIGYYVLQNNIENGACKYCGESIPGVWS